MRKRPILLAAAALAAGLAALGTVGAQSPGGFGQPQSVPAGNSPGYVPPGGVKHAGGAVPPSGQPSRPRITTPVVAGPDGVRPVSAILPPPNMSAPPALPNVGAAPPAGAMPPPSITVDPIPAAGSAIPALPPGVTPVPLPAVPNVGVPQVPVAPSAPVLPVPLPSADGAGSPAPLPASVVPVPPGPGTTLVRPAVGSLAARVSHNITVEAVCPETVVFGQEFRYELVIHNSGTTSVGGVRVEDGIPAATKYIGSDPPAEVNGDRLSWNVGDLDAGAEKRIAIRLNPIDEGEVRSHATVTFAAAVEAVTKVTRPRVTVAVTGPEVCKVGEEPVFQIKVTNSGTGPAQRMVLRAKLSDGLTHPHLHPPEMMIEATLANLPPGETRTIPLQQVAATKAGMQWCQISVAVPGCQDTAAKTSVKIVEPLLQIAQIGPAKCFVRGEPVYEITLTNPGTATTDPITLYTVLPEGFEYTQGSDNATFSASNRVVMWKLPGLAAGGTKPVTLKLHAATAGEGSLRTIAQTTPEQPPVVGAAGGVPAKPAGHVLEAKAETAVKSEGVSSVRFEVIDLDDPIGVGKEAIYEIRVMNQGTGACTNVQLVAALAEGTEYKGSSGPTQIKPQGQHLIFEPIPTLGAKGEAVFRVKVQGTKSGDLRFRVQLTCDQVRTPIVKEESTRFYKE